MLPSMMDRRPAVSEPRRIDFGKTVTADGFPIAPRERRAAEAPALAEIRRALQQPSASGDREFLTWFGARAGR